MEDIFELLQKEKRCEFISDLILEQNIFQTKRILSKMDLSKYDLHSLNDVIKYIYQTEKDFETKEQAIASGQICSQRKS